MSQSQDQDQDQPSRAASWGRGRRRCSLCGRAEASYPLHLVGIWVDGKPCRACDECRALNRRTWHCQVCGLEQGGQRYGRADLVVCPPCAERIDRYDGPADIPLRRG